MALKRKSRLSIKSQSAVVKIMACSCSITLSLSVSAVYQSEIYWARPEAKSTQMTNLRKQSLWFLLAQPVISSHSYNMIITVKITILLIGWFKKVMLQLTSSHNTIFNTICVISK